MDNCIFCKIANGEIPSSTIYEDTDYKVIFDMGPMSKGHCLIIPKEHFNDLTSLPDRLSGGILPLAGRIGRAAMKAFKADGFNVLQNNGPSAGQTVMHFHTHVIPRYQGEKPILTAESGSVSKEELSEMTDVLREELLGETANL